MLFHDECITIMRLFTRKFYSFPYLWKVHFQEIQTAGCYGKFRKQPRIYHHVNEILEVAPTFLTKEKVINRSYFFRLLIALTN